VKALQKKSVHSGLREEREIGFRRSTQGRESDGSQGVEGSNSSEELYKHEEEESADKREESSESSPSVDRSEGEGGVAWESSSAAEGEGKAWET
jgi:hypothetical protein